MKSDLAKRGICLIAGLYALLPVAAQTTPTTELPVRRDSAAWISPTRPQQASHLTLDEAIYAAQTQSIAAMVAKYTFLSSYWSYRSYRASRLPSLNLTGEVLSFDRSLRLLQDYDTGEMRYMENYNLQNTLGLSIKQNIALTGGTLRLYSSLNRLDQFAPKDSKSYYSQPITLSYTQPLFAYNQFKWDKKIAPKEYELAKRTYIEAMEDITIQAVTYYFNLLLSKTKHTIAVKNYSNTKSLYAIAEQRLELGSVTKDELLQLQLRMLNDSLSINDTALAARESQMKLNSYLRFSETTEIEPLLDDRIPPIEIDYATVLDKALANSSFEIDNQIRQLNAEAAIAQAKSERGASATINARFGLSQTGDDLRTAYSQPAGSGGRRVAVLYPDLRLGNGQRARAHGQGQGRNAPQPDRAGPDRLPARRLHAHRTILQSTQPMRRSPQSARSRRPSLCDRHGEFPAWHDFGHRDEYGTDRKGRSQPDLRLGYGRLLELLLLAAPQNALRLHFAHRYQRRIR